MKTPSKSVMDSLSVGAGWHIYDDFGEYSFTYPSDVLGGISGIWLPALGCRAESSGSISGVNTIGYYWLSTQVGFKFDQSTTSNFTFTTGEAYGFCVTPIYE